MTWAVPNISNSCVIKVGVINEPIENAIKTNGMYDSDKALSIHFEG